MTLIHVGTGAQPHDFRAVWLDGHAARAPEIAARIEDGPVPMLRLAVQGAAEKAWPLEEVRRLPDQAGQGQIVLTHPSDPLARVVVSEPEACRLIAARCRNLDRAPPRRGLGRIALWAVGAVASVALIILVLVPQMANQLATYLPPEGEVALGQSTLGQIRDAIGDGSAVGICETPEGRRALDEMTARLIAQTDLPYPVQVDVLDNELVNAFALPGGQIVLFRGLIDAAEHPDEVAAVLAHEIGHVVNRDPTRTALRTAGSLGVLGLLFGDFAGGTVVLFLTERLIQASYSQEAESAADAFAHGTLARAGIPPGALADMFERLRDRSGEEPGVIRHFLAHPGLGDRIAAARAADADRAEVYRPALGEADWQALQRICITPGD
ncbi:M48 family metallopeptidase [Anianabacter salinae]|uniref:M48 family metallopeptidase n=1 Tax=Anianabacter salinae TaxID=2851023 RepID=UPI00225E1562|nr:M48 family metallopeptidase [Anianabacter salinae]MBV0913177.1 M48 family metallopeptidase [Anianabacter salinae]